MKINVTCVTDGKNHTTITKSRTKKVNVINEIVIITMIIIIIIIMMMINFCLLTVDCCWVGGGEGWVELLRY